MTKRSSVGKSMFVRNWGNPDNQPEFNNPSIQRGLDLAKKPSKSSLSLTNGKQKKTKEDK